jgi:hypothetical protein
MTNCLSYRLASLISRGALVLCLLAATESLAAQRRAPGAPDHGPQEKAARKACLTGSFAKGVSILADLFVETRNPIYIFNQGRCYEQNRRYEDAIAQFEEFLRSPEGKLTQDDKAEAEKHIEECKSKLPKEHIEPPPPTVPALPLVTPPPPEPVPVAQPAVTVRKPVAPVPGKRRWGLITTGIIASAVGVGGIATGIVFNAKANDAAMKIETVVGAYPASSKDQKDFKTYAWIGYGVGAACLATGVVLVTLGAVRSSPGSSPRVAFAPAFGPGQVGAILQGGF